MDGNNTTSISNLTANILMDIRNDSYTASVQTEEPQEG